MKIDDDTLIAYLDAQLEDDAAYEAVEDALAESATLRARLQVLAETGELARQAFDAKLEEAVPPRLIAAIMDAPLPGAEKAANSQERAGTTTSATDNGLAHAPARPAEDHEESRLYAPDYVRRFRPQTALANSPTAAPADEGRGERQHAGC